MNFLDIFYPKFCCGCGRFGNYLCRKCLSSIVCINEQRCSGCERISEFGFTHAECMNDTPLSASISLYPYQGIIKKMLKEIKYNKASEMMRDIMKVSKGSIYEKFFPLRKLVSSYTAIQPVPLHPRREKMRGFNQSMYIAQDLSRYLGVPIISAVYRERDTPSQAAIVNKSFRLKNMKRAFYSEKRDVAHETIIVVDDIFTTGSTCREVGFCLKNVGVKNVISFTIAHG